MEMGVDVVEEQTFVFATARVPKEVHNALVALLRLRGSSYQEWLVEQERHALDIERQRMHRDEV